MDAYRLYTVVPYLLKFIDNLTNIYVRFNRKRLKGRTGEDDCRTALSALYHVLLTCCKAMAPFTPFFTEILYRNLRKVSNGSEESIHFCSFPQVEGKVLFFLLMIASYILTFKSFYYNIVLLNFFLISHCTLKFENSTLL
ncbi:isoleucine--tRNA ligase, cytoplasmic-like [Lactuca sativa]|uniref:isoleucine--tRNA ligase, cytoplasmic-like n=1 Tax=Lactuca sativa TaxID=4236 RepID=UPI0022AF0E8C|nr:isoleucine--tRNA ligase, cytoplasmic-like [Lactuca sativa]